MMTTLKKRLLCGLTALTFAAAGVGAPAVGETGLDFDIFATAADIVAYGDCGNPNVNEGKDVTWTLDSEGTLTISGMGEMCELFSTYVKKENIRKVIIQDGVLNVGIYAFDNCVNLESIYLPNSITEIEYYAFRNCTNLKEITIPNKVSYIESSTFLNCSNLTSVVIPNGVTEIGYEAFLGCSSLKEISIPKSVTEIVEKAIGYNDNDNKVDNFKMYCYYGSKAEDYALDNKLDYLLLDSISGTCGEYCTWTLDETRTLTISGNGEMSDILEISKEDNGTGSTTYYCCNQDSIKRLVVEDGVTNIDGFIWCGSLTEVCIGNSVERIDDYAFNCCTNLQKIIIPNNVKDIGRYAFMGCGRLFDITFPNNVSIGVNAFEGTAWKKNRLEESPYVIINNILLDATTVEDEVVIPEGVENINPYSINNAVKKIYLSSTVKTIYYYNDHYLYDPFSNCKELTTIDVSENNPYYTSIDGVLYNKDKTILRRCPLAKEFVTISDNTRYIDRYAFSYCDKIKNIDIPNNVTKISYDAFTDCTALENVKLSESISELDMGTFLNCSSLKSIEIPNNVKGIYHAFSGCKNLQTVLLGNGVETIGDRAFIQCTSLNEIIIPATVTKIGRQALGYYCEETNRHYYEFSYPEYKDEFNKLTGFKIYCYAGTAGEQYAIDNGFDYELLDGASANHVALQYTPAEGEPAPLLSNLSYTVCGSQSQIVRSAKADANGNIDLSGLPEGEYTVELELKGFAPRKVEYKTGEDLGEIKLCKYGDCTGDGSIDTEDIARMQQKISKWNVNYVYDETADLNGDGEMDTEDLARLQQYISGWNVKLGKVS